MPIHVIEAPASALNAARTTLQELATRGEFGTPGLRGARPEALGLTLPHPIYNLGLDDVAASRLPSAAARRTGWRFLVHEDGRILAAAELAGSTDDDFVFAALNEGPFVRTTETTLEEAEKLSEVDSGQFELRLLRIPALYVMALWLKGENGAADIIMAMTPAPPELIIGEAYDEARFISQLSASASQTSPGRAVPR